LIVREILVQQIQAGTSAARLATGVRDNLPRLSSQAYRFTHSREGNLPAPASTADEFPSSAVCHVIQHLPDHDASAFECGLAVTNFRISHNMFAKLNPFGKALRNAALTIFHTEKDRTSFLACWQGD
jgi:hypothetical protein